MGDGDMKICLEDAGRILKEFRCPVLLETLAKMGRNPSPPSPAHMLVMEALTILLTPQTLFHKCTPLSSLRGVAWTEAQHMLASPTKFWAAIASVDMFEVPETNAYALQVREL